MALSACVLGRREARPAGEEGTELAVDGVRSTCVSASSVASKNVLVLLMVPGAGCVGTLVRGDLRRVDMDKRVL
jgi:hypothetical protein